MTTVGVLGGLSVDHLVLEPIGTRFSCLGGPGLFAALGASSISGVRARLACGLPEDDGRFATVLTERGVDIAHTWPVPAVPHVWILNSADGRRVVDTAPVRGIELDAVSGTPAPPVDAVDDAFVDGLDGLLVSAPSAGVERRGRIVGVDPDQSRIAARGWHHLAELLQPGDLVLPSRVQLWLLGPDPRTVALQIAERFGVTVVARLDTEGMHVVDSVDRWDLHDPDVEVVETTGAGDASAAAIVAARATGRTALEAAALGMSVARIVLADWGHSALMTHPPLTEPFPTIRITNHA